MTARWISSKKSSKRKNLTSHHIFDIVNTCSQYQLSHLGIIFSPHGVVFLHRYSIRYFPKSSVSFSKLWGIFIISNYAITYFKKTILEKYLASLPLTLAVDLLCNQFAKNFIRHNRRILFLIHLYIWKHFTNKYSKISIDESDPWIEQKLSQVICKNIFPISRKTPHKKWMNLFDEKKVMNKCSISLLEQNPFEEYKMLIKDESSIWLR